MLFPSPRSLNPPKKEKQADHLPQQAKQYWHSSISLSTEMTTMPPFLGRVVKTAAV